MKIVIVGSGGFRDPGELLAKIGEVDYIICADGGASHLYKAHITPNIILGDLDSISREALTYFNHLGVEMEKFPVKKDKTDMALAIDYAINLGASEIILLGATGTRLDHTLGNIFILKYISDLGIKSRIIDNHNEIFIVKDKLILERQKDTYVSILPLMDDVGQITLVGFEYELKKEPILYASTLGISNRVNRNKALIEVEGGICLVIVAKD